MEIRWGFEDFCTLYFGSFRGLYSLDGSSSGGGIS